MKTTSKLQLLLLAILIAFPILGQAQDKLKSHPAYLPIDGAIDLAVAKPEVNVNLPRFLLQNVVSELDGGPDDPFAEMDIDFKDLVKGIELLRVVVIESNDTNKEQINKGVKKLRQQLESDWTPIVSVPEDGVGIYGLSDESGNAMAGIALLINDDGDVVIGNLVGEVSIGKVIKIATQMKSLPPGLMEQLAGFSGGGSSDAKKENTDEAKE
jgi:hypothetical protein